MADLTIGYDFEVFTLSKTAMVPVPRIANIVLFKYWPTLNDAEAVSLATFLFRHYECEQAALEALRAKCEDSQVLTTLATGTEHPANNCEKCMRDFYLRAVCHTANKRMSFSCLQCAQAVTKNKDYVLLLFAEADRVATLLRRVVKDGKKGSGGKPKDNGFAYIGQGDSRLQRLEFWQEAPTNLAIAQSRSKAEHKRAQLACVTLSLEQLKHDRAKAASEKRIKDLEIAIKKRQTEHDQLTRSLRK